MAIDASHIEDMRRAGPDWRGTGATRREDARLMGNDATPKTPFDPYSAENNSNIRVKMEANETPATPNFEPAPRRGFLTKVLGKFGLS